MKEKNKIEFTLMGESFNVRLVEDPESTGYREIKI